MSRRDAELLSGPIAVALAELARLERRYIVAPHALRELRRALQLADYRLGIIKDRPRHRPSRNIFLSFKYLAEHERV